ncbi:flagellar basal body-associated FliL family protein [Nocardioides pacificus]
MIVSAINPEAAAGSTGTGKKGKKAKGDAEPRSKKKLLMIVGVVVLVAAAAWWFMLKPSGAEPPPEPGEVVSMEPIQVNLTGGHYLKIGLALQLTTTAHEADGSKALDAAIDLFSGQDFDKLSNPEYRGELKEKLIKELEHDYHGDVMEVYFTDFVTQ